MGSFLGLRIAATSVINTVTRKWTKEDAKNRPLRKSNVRHEELFLRRSAKQKELRLEGNTNKLLDIKFI